MKRPPGRKLPFFAVRSALRCVYRLHCLARRRPPTGDELIAYRNLMRQGAWLEDIATRLMPGADVRAILDQIETDPAIDRVRLLPLLLPGGVRLLHDGDYLWWVEENEAIFEDDRATIRRLTDAMTMRPRLSFVVGVTRPAAPTLHETLQSIASQAYPEVEILVVASPEAAAVIDRSLHLRPAGNIRLIAAPTARTTADFFNAALQECTGSYLGLVGEADRLAETAAFEVAAALVGHPDTGLIYSDEDAIDRKGSRHSPRLKPNWDADAVLAQNQVGRLALFSTKLLRELGGMRAHHGALAEHDLLLRADGAIDAHQIQHLPSILYHRRAERASAWSRLRARMSYRATRAQVRLIREHLAASGTAGCLVSAPRTGGPIRVTYPLPVPPPLVSIVVPTRDRVELLRTCLRGLLQGTSYRPIEVIVVDNDSVAAETHEYLASLAHDSRVRVMRHPGPFNWSAMNNRAVAAAAGEVVVLLNNDTEVLHPDWLDEMVTHALRPVVGLVGAKLLYHDRRVQHAGMASGPVAAMAHVWRYAAEHDPGYMNSLSIVHGISAVTGACIAMRKSVFNEVGGLDEVNLKVTCSDSDLCFRVRARGYRVIWTPYARLIHAELATRGADDSGEKAARARREHAHLCATWGSWLDEDPFLNANLQRTDVDAHLVARSRPRPWHITGTEPA